MLKQRLNWRGIALLALSVLLLSGGCSALDEQQRRWIFQPSHDSWNGGRGAAGLDEVWIDFTSRESGTPVKLYGLWMPQPDPKAPLLLYLHGARWDVRSSAFRMRRLHDLGFAVLGIDYRGFGRSTDVLPSESYAYEDARAAWDWLATAHPGVQRYVYGHSLGSAIAVHLATDIADPPAGVMLEGAFTSIADVVGSFKYGWIPVRPLLTQQFDALSRIDKLKAPLLMVHGGDDRLIASALGRALFEKAPEPKRFLLVDGGSHHDASARDPDGWRAAVQALFKLPGAAPALQ